MTLELVPWRGQNVPVLSPPEVSRASLADYMNWVMNSDRYMGPPAPMTTYGTKAAEPISSSFEGFTLGMLYPDGPVAAVEAYRLRVFGQAPLLYQELINGRPGDMFDDDSLERLRAPWPAGSLADLMKRALMYGDLGGNAFVLDLEDELVLTRPDWVEIVLAKRMYRGGQVGWKQVGIMYYEGGLHAGDGVAFLPGEYGHFVPGLPDPLASYRGMSWLTPLIREIQADKAASDHKVAFFENAASPNLAVSLPKEITPAQFAEFVDKMDGQHKGVMNAYKTLYTAGGADVTVIGANMQQMDFSSVQGKGETRVANAGGVPPTLLSFSEGMQGSSLNAGNYTAAKRNFVDTTMRDLWGNFAASLQQMDAFQPPRKATRLWYDGRDIPFLHEDAQDLAQIQQTQAATLASHIAAGWEPDTAKQAVLADDLSVLKHSGMMSVQLQPPGAPGEPGADPAAAQDAAADEYQQALEEFRADLSWANEVVRKFDPSQLRDHRGRWALTAATIAAFKAQGGEQGGTYFDDGRHFDWSTFHATTQTYDFEVGDGEDAVSFEVGDYDLEQFFNALSVTRLRDSTDPDSHSPALAALARLGHADHIVFEDGASIDWSTRTESGDYGFGVENGDEFVEFDLSPAEMDKLIASLALSTQATEAVNAARSYVTRFDPSELRVEGGEHGGEWTSGGVLKDVLKLAGKIDLADGETLAGSDKLSADNGSIRLAAVDHGGKRSLRLGIGDQFFGGRDDEAGPWRAGRGDSAAENARRAPLRAEMEALESAPDSPENDKRYAELSDMDLGEVYASGHTASLDAPAAAKLMTTLRDALAAGKERQAEFDADDAEMDRLDNLFSEATPEQWEAVNEQYQALKAKRDHGGDYDVFAEGVIAGDWADVHYQVLLDDPDVGVQTILSAVPHGMKDVGDEHANLDPAEAAKLVRLLAKMSGLEASRSMLLRADYYNIRVDAGLKGGGRFRKISDIIGQALNDWLDGKGDRDDPLEPFTHGSDATVKARLRKASKELGVEPPPRASIEELKLGLLKDARARHRAQSSGDAAPAVKKAVPGVAAEPAKAMPPGKLTAGQLSGMSPEDIRQAHAEGRVTADVAGRRLRKAADAVATAVPVDQAPTRWSRNQDRARELHAMADAIEATPRTRAAKRVPAKAAPSVPAPGLRTELAPKAIADTNERLRRDWATPALASLEREVDAASTKGWRDSETLGRLRTLERDLRAAEADNAEFPDEAAKFGQLATSAQGLVRKAEGLPTREQAEQAEQADEAEAKNAVARVKAAIQAAGGLADQQTAMRPEIAALKKANRIPGDAAIKRLPPDSRRAAEQAVWAISNAAQARVAAANNALQARALREHLANSPELNGEARRRLENALRAVEGPGSASAASVETFDRDRDVAVAVWRAVSGGDAGPKGLIARDLWDGLAPDEQAAVVRVSEHVGSDAARRLVDEFKRAAPADTKASKRPALDPDATLTDLRGRDREAARDALDLHTIPQLKALMPAGMPKSGKKRELVDRLTEHLHPVDEPTVDEKLAVWDSLTPDVRGIWLRKGLGPEDVSARDVRQARSEGRLTDHLHPDDDDHTPGTPEARAAEPVTAPEPTPAGAIRPGQYSSKPILENQWGAGRGGKVAYHDDGPIGMAVKAMGQDQRLDVDGEPLANVIGEIATESVHGQIDTNEMLDQLRTLRDRLPVGSRARDELSGAIDDVDSPPRPPLDMPSSTPAPMVALMDSLSRNPLARQDRRGDGGSEMDELAAIAEDFEAGRVGGLRLITAVRQLSNRRHESYGAEGKMELDRDVIAAADQLQALYKADRESLRPRARAEVSGGVEVPKADGGQGSLSGTGVLTLLPPAQRGRSGDEYVPATDGSYVWGPYGSSGVLFRHVGADGQPRYLLVQRGPGIDNPGKWQFPGGARDEHETAAQGAAREAMEELGVSEAQLAAANVHGAHVYQGPGDWTYTSIAADVQEAFTPDLGGRTWETSDARWLTAAEIRELDSRGELHSPLAKGALEGNVVSLFPEVAAPAAAQPARPDTRWRPTGVTAADEQALRAALKSRRPTTGMPGASDMDYVEKLANENNSERLLGQFVERHPELRARGGEQAKQILATKAKAAFASRPVAIGITPKALEAVLREGRFKTQLETGTSRGVYQPEDRIRREREWFGVPRDADPADRPIYGYLASKTSGPKGLVAMYGDVQVVLKDDVRSRTTAMVGDSMGHIAEGAPSSVDDPDWRAFTPASDDHAHLPIGKLDRDYDGAAFTRNDYIEAQVHGGVTADDIAEVVLSSQPSPELRTLLEERGIAWRTRRSNR